MAASAMNARGMATPIAALAPVERPDDDFAGEEVSVAEMSWPLLVDTASALPEAKVLVGMTRFLMVGREALGLTFHPEAAEVGHFGVVLAGE